MYFFFKRKINIFLSGHERPLMCEVKGSLLMCSTRWHVHSGKCSLQTDKVQLQITKRMLQTVKVQLQTNKRTLQTTKRTLQTLKRMLQTTERTLQTLNVQLQTTKCTLQTHWVQLQTYSAHIRSGNRTMRSGSVGVLYQHRSVNILCYAPTPWFVASRTTFIKMFLQTIIHFLFRGYPINWNAILSGQHGPLAYEACMKSKPIFVSRSLIERRIPKSEGRYLGRSFALWFPFE